MDIHEIILDLETRIESMLGRSRRAHSRRVARLAAELCHHEGIPEHLGTAAALAHDLCKEMAYAEQCRLARAFFATHPEGEDVTFLCETIPHGPAAASLLRGYYGPLHPDILEAVAYHTTGRPGMSRLATIVYCADKLEPGRKDLDAGFRTRCLSLPLDAMVATICRRSIAWLDSTGSSIAPQTQAMNLEEAWTHP